MLYLHYRMDWYKLCFMSVYSIVDDNGKLIKEGIDLCIEILMNQLHAFSQISEEKMKSSDVRSVTEISKTLAMLDKMIKENVEESHDILQMTAEEISAEAEKIMKSRLVA